jgi:hypothetical protein
MAFKPPSQQELTKQCLEWWKENRPTMYRELGAGVQDMAAWAARATLEAYQSMVGSGLAPEEAWEVASQMWVFLESEEERPRLVALEEAEEDEADFDLSDLETNSPAGQPTIPSLSSGPLKHPLPPHLSQPAASTPGPGELIL